MDLYSPRKDVFSIASLDMIRDSQFEKQWSKDLRVASVMSLMGLSRLG